MRKRRVSNTLFEDIYCKYLLLKREIRYFLFKHIDEKFYPSILKYMYKKATGHKLNMNNPQTYNEKMQWTKLHDNSLIKADLTDKYKVRGWIKDNIGEKYLVPLLGVWDNFEQIDFDNLPDKFVLKATHGSGWNYIVLDKATFDRREAKRNFDKWLKTNYAYYSLEMHYKLITPKIIAEKFIESFQYDLEDYKFICFDGETKFCWIDANRYSDHRRNVYDINWKLQPWQQHSYKNTDLPIQKPKNFDLMIELTNRLAKGFSHVRVDWYNIEGKIYFGEMTFTNSSGFEYIWPQQYNIMLGDMWEI